MLQVSHAGGWFTVRDLEGTESRYRKKEMISLTRTLLKQPKFGVDSRLDLAALVDIPRQVPPKPAPKNNPAPAKQIQNTSAASELEIAKAEAEAKKLNFPSKSPGSEQPFATRTGAENQVEPSDIDGKITPFPLTAPSPDVKRKLENKAYFRNLRRILLIVATVIGFVVLVIAFRRH